MAVVNASSHSRKMPSLERQRTPQPPAGGDGDDPEQLSEIAASDGTLTLNTSTPVKGPGLTRFAHKDLKSAPQITSLASNSAFVQTHLTPYPSSCERFLKTSKNLQLAAKLKAAQSESATYRPGRDLLNNLSTTMWSTYLWFYHLLSTHRVHGYLKMW